MSKISELVGKATDQRVSPEVLEVAHEEIAVLQRTINEQAKLIDSLESRLENQAVTIKVQAATIANLANTPQNPVICPVEPPVPTLTANVSREAVGVHPAPNVTIAKEGKL